MLTYEKLLEPRRVLLTPQLGPLLVRRIVDSDYESFALRGAVAGDRRHRK
jgi:hypothetical protein